MSSATSTRLDNDGFLMGVKDRLAKDRQRQMLAEASGISNYAVLDSLIDLGMNHDTVAAFSLAPLVQVAWADGNVDQRERTALLMAANQTGIACGSPAYRTLERWLETKPDESLMSDWKAYVAALCQRLTPEGKNALKLQLLSRARKVAEAAGGFLGLVNRISSHEQFVLAEIDRTLAAN